MLVNVNLSDAPIVISKITTPKEMISISTERNKTKVRINSSSLSVIQECSRKAKYSLKEKWKSENESPALVFGTAIHKALEVFYSGNFSDRKLPRLEDLELMSYGHKIEGEETDLLLRAVRAFVEKAKPLEQIPETDKRSIQNGVYTLWHYFKSYLNDPYMAYVDKDGPFIERTISFVLHEDEDLIVEYFGTIDLIVQNIATGDVLVCDHKTSSVVGADFYNRLKPNHQYTGYLMAAREVFGLKTNSFLVNCVQVKEKPKTSKGTPPNFPRQVTTRDDDDYSDFREAVVTAVRSYLHSLRTGSWPMGHVNTCATYGGCQYLQTCSAPKSMRETILRSKFNNGEINANTSGN